MSCEEKLDISLALTSKKSMRTVLPFQPALVRPVRKKKKKKKKKKTPKKKPKKKKLIFLDFFFAKFFLMHNRIAKGDGVVSVHSFFRKRVVTQSWR